MNKRTAGPWRQFAPDIEGHGIDQNYRRIEGGLGCSQDGFSLTGFVSEADAQMMAAAPDLLEALTGLLAEVEYVISAQTIPRTWLDSQNPDIAIVNARNALSKTGKQS